MNNYRWLLEERLNDDDYLKFSKVLDKRGIPHQKFHGLFNGYTSHEDKIPEEAFYFHGTIGGALILRNNPNNILSFTPRNYACTAYYPYFQSYLLNKDYQIHSMRQMGIHFADYKGQLFVRPDSGLKNFIGSVLKDYEISGLISMCSHYDMTDLVITAPAQTIEAEWRLLYKRVGNKEFKYITGSEYQNMGEHEENPDVDSNLIEYTTKMLNVCNYSPDPYFYVDMALAGSGPNKMFVLNELSAFPCAGPYACDINKIIDSLQEDNK